MVEVCKYLNCIAEDDETVANKSRRALMRMSEKKLDEIEQSTEAEEAIQTIQELLSAAKRQMTAIVKSGSAAQSWRENILCCNNPEKP